MHHTPMRWEIQRRVQHVDALNGQIARLWDAFESLEKKIEVSQMNICELYTQLDKSQLACTC